MHQEVSVLALIKGNDRYIYVYDLPSSEKLLDAIRDQAADPNLNLSWFDAAVLVEKARQQWAAGSTLRNSANDRIME